jgi:uracil-DNA glycosylase family 4
MNEASRQAHRKLQEEITACRACPRLVEWREKVAREKTRRYADRSYWGKPVPSLGDPEARVWVVGLAPAAHGANRTGRMFTGDRSGDWLFAALYRAGFANQPEGREAEDGLVLHDCYVSAVVRCAPPANKPNHDEFAACRPFLDRELELLERVNTIVCMGGIAFTHTLRMLVDHGYTVPKPRPRFGHGVELSAGSSLRVLASYHPSQQNTFTGRLTEAMLDAVFVRAGELARRESDTP